MSLQDDSKTSVSRRDFTALSVAAGVAASTGSALAADAVVEKDVSIRTADGVCDAAYFHPATGVHPAVIIWTDIFGLRPSFREMGRRVAAEGYAVLVPNPFYRTAKSPVVEDASKFDFSNPTDRAKTAAWTGPMNKTGAIESDAATFINFLDAQKEVDKTRKMGTQGYCMGGPLVFKTMAVRPGRMGAGATFHGGGLVTDKPDSPHRLIEQMSGQLYIAIAASDDDKQPDAKDKLKAAIAAAHSVKGEVVVYTGMQHGWTVPDMPAANGMPIYNKPEAERAFSKLLELYKTALA